MAELVVKELTPSLRDDFLLFFDSVAFDDNPDWADCYCSAYHFANKGKAESRRQSSSLIQEDRMHGFLAYDSGKPIGWCNAANRNSYPAIHWLMGPGPDKAERVGSIVCFVVASSHRSKGIASTAIEGCMHEVFPGRARVCGSLSGQEAAVRCLGLSRPVVDVSQEWVQHTPRQ